MRETERLKRIAKPLAEFPDKSAPKGTPKTVAVDDLPTRDMPIPRDKRIRNFTDQTPVIQISEVVVENSAKG